MNRSFRIELILFSLVFSSGLFYQNRLANAQSIPAPVPQRTLEGYLQPFLKQYCRECHDSVAQDAAVNLERFWGNDAMYEDREIWEKVIHSLSERDMPPEDKPQPNEELRLRMIDFIQMKLDEFDCDELAQPGRVTIRRLNRIEYANTIRDLLGVEFEATAEFPADEVGYGFDNIGDVLSLSPLQMERYLDAAIKITNEAIVTEMPVWPPITRYEAEEFESHVEGDGIRPYAVNGLYMGLYVTGRASKNITVSTPGTYRLRARAYGEQAGDDLTELELVVDDRQIASFVVDTYDDNPGFYEAEVQLTGQSNLAIGFLNNYNQNQQDRNLLVDYVDIQGPLGVTAPPLPENHTRIIPGHPEPGDEMAAARSILTDFGTKAYRRPIQPEEVERLVELVGIVLEDGGSFEESIQVAVQAVLSSTAFLYRWELDSGPQPAIAEAASAEPSAENLVRSLNDYELASRLSYYLWNSMPDEELFAAAARHELSQTGKLISQVERMLKDPKSQRFINNFVGQWLQIRNLDRVTPDPDLFPEFDTELKDAMRQETEMFFNAMVREDRSVLDLLDADFTFLNERLADHYGIEGIQGEDFQRVQLGPASHRGGVLTHASILTITSNPDRTSPVIRGKWILEQILATPPPPPPANVPELETTGTSDAVLLTSLREKLELHRDKPECAACHQKMDPIGFAFENFDAIGRWRDLDGRSSIDSSGTLTTGEDFEDSAELMSVLKSRDEFTRAITEKMMTYALGRGLEYYDKCSIDSITDQLKNNDYRFSALISGIVTSDPFRMRQTEGESR